MAAYESKEAAVSLPVSEMVDVLQMIEWLQRTIQGFEDEFNNSFLDAQSALHRTGWEKH